MTTKLLSRGLPLTAVCVLLLSLSGCPFSTSLPSGAASDAEVQHVSQTGSFTYTVDPGDAAKDVYFVFTNLKTTMSGTSAPTVSTDSITVDGNTLPAPATLPLVARNGDPATAMEKMAEFNRDPFAALGTTKSTWRTDTLSAPGSPSYDAVGDSGSMYDLDTSGDLSLKAAHCRYVSSPITVEDGSTRTLNIWVADDCWISGGTKAYRVTQEMVDTLAAKYLATGLDNDIYDWDTNVSGAEWGDTQYTNLIPANNEITILLSDIEDDNSSNGGTVGYFYSMNNFTNSWLEKEYGASSAISNERVMFVIDAVMYACPLYSGDDSTWKATDYWPKVVFSTLAHEFQHMIMFYQKEVVAEAAASADIWIDEMCAQIMEDLVADKQGVEGPRGVSASDGTAGSAGNTDGRIPEFTAYSSTQLTQTTNAFYTDTTLCYYGTSYAFGAWLARNYGGAELLRNIVQSAETDETAVVNAAADASGKTESMQRLLEKWAAAVLLSDTTTAPAGYQYNTGGWITSTAGDTTYNLGSINIFNYDPALTVYDVSSTIGKGSYSSNLYCKAASQLAEKKTFTITIPTGYAMSVVLK